MKPSTMVMLWGLICAGVGSFFSCLGHMIGAPEQTIEAYGTDGKIVTGTGRQSQWSSKLESESSR